MRKQNISVKLVEPGHVPSTRIGETVMANSKGIPIPPDCRADHDRITAMFSSTSPDEGTTEREVAGVILAAASDDSDALRFVIGADVRMWRETSEADYICWASGRFEGE